MRGRGRGCRGVGVGVGVHTSPNPNPKPKPNLQGEVRELRRRLLGIHPRLACAEDIGQIQGDLRGIYGGIRQI